MYMYVAYFMRVVIIRQLVKHVSSYTEHSALPCLPTASTAVLGLDAHDGVQDFLSHVTLVSAESHQQLHN